MNMCTFCPWKVLVTSFIVQVFALVMCIITIVKNANSPLGVLISVVVGTMSAWLLLQRDTHLPFLGYAALPPSLLKGQFAPSDANVESVIDVDAPDGARILYWGARSADDVKSTPWKAYDDWSNAGVAVVKNKKAVVIFNCPGKYRVPVRGELERHIHYRVCMEELAMIGPVQTVNVKC